MSLDDLVEASCPSSLGLFLFVLSDFRDVGDFCRPEMLMVLVLASLGLGKKRQSSSSDESVSGYRAGRPEFGSAARHED